MDLADIIVTLSAGFRASAWFMAHMTELMYAYPGVLPAAVSSQQQQAGAGRMQGSTARGGGGSSLVQNISRSLLSRVLPREGCDQVCVQCTPRCVCAAMVSCVGACMFRNCSVAGGFHAVCKCSAIGMDICMFCTHTNARVRVTTRHNVCMRVCMATCMRLCANT